MSYFNNLSLNSWLEKIAEFKPSDRIDKELNLTAVALVGTAMDLTRFSCPVLTVTGTNGKGSTVATLVSIYKQQYRVGSFTSPHLFCVNERIALNGENIDDKRLCAAFAAVDVVKEQLQVKLSFFEYFTLAALYIFKQEKIDVVVLEVGLGGRLDATNIVANDVAIISNVALDHMHFLGDTREKIGAEKAGIIKPGIITILGKDAVIESVLIKATQEQARLFVENVDFSLVNGDIFEFYFAMGNITIAGIKTNLLKTSVVLGLAAINLLQDRLPISEDLIKKALVTAKLPGRLQVFTLKNGVSIVFDVAHNPDGANYLARYLKENSIAGKNIAVWHSLADKDLINIVFPLKEIITTWCVGSVIGTHRASSAETLMHVLDAALIVESYAFNQVNEALVKATQLATINDRIVVFGGFNIVAELMQVLELN